MRFYSELKRIIIQKVSGLLSGSVLGELYFRTDLPENALFVKTNTADREIPTENTLPRMRRVTKVQLDDATTGNEVQGILPYTKGGTGFGGLAGYAGMALIVNDTETGFVFREVEMIGSDSLAGAATGISNGGVTTIVAPANAIGCYVQADENNSSDLRLAFGTGSPTVSTGVSLMPGVTEFIRSSADLKVISETGSGMVLNYTWVIR